ncbi:hypothetical protein [Cryobacterium sp. PH29-G1]|uniref:hypothetical protein n=1 Tax=Cryobacterium sp. PH29-G1 TaxID=3046211 RepID=UPI0024B992A1|nr:hypothetical protein [Cryobacterium sp. PH29-G1]MDJ0350025.1 hypothetical protein [Cryobacterium sp. PH29-G1]
MNSHLPDDALARRCRHPVVPLVDVASLHELCQDLGGDVRIQKRFVNDFIALWQPRAVRLGTALAASDVEAADVVLLSIRSSSTMLGARRLESFATQLHGALRARDLSACARQLPQLSLVGSDTCRALSRHLARVPD